MRYREFNERISRADAEIYTARLKLAMRDIKADERARHITRDDDWLLKNDNIDDTNARYALNDRVERLQREKLKRHLIKKHGNKINNRHVDAAYANHKLRQHRILMKHRKKR